ncbi:glycosyltransferase [Mumia sp. DW29H23]|uniref:glycosyltransferase n=1 Tax=Mumia sp. DW29H23 TaxID=3421241 RepID=UPI003D69A366
MARDAEAQAGPPSSALPAGTYLSVARGIRLGKGGRTAALLMRARILGELGGRRSLVATYDAYPDYDEVRDALVARGVLETPSRLVNLFEDYRSRSPEALGAGTAPLPLLAGTRARANDRADGTPGTWSHVDEDGAVVAVDHRRPDGSVFLREAVDHDRAEFSLVDHAGRVVRSWRRRPGMVRSWLRGLAPSGPVFAVTDSRFTVRMLLGLRSRRFHVLEVVHNPHTVPDYRWDRPVQPTFRGVLDRLAELDGLVLLTERQRHDVALRFGATTNLLTVPNPVWPVADDGRGGERDRARFVVLGRLEAQKRVTHALDALAVARRSDSTVTLDVYGEGSRRSMLEEHARTIGVDHCVTFHGHDPGARERLRTATALLVTSSHEGYPLATLEAMSRGCPVIGYDVRYGMREQVSDGENGFLLAEGDVEGLADRMLTLAGDPALLERMSGAARRRAADHAPERVLGDWAAAFTRVRDQAASRTVITDSALTRAELAVRRSLLRGREDLRLDATVRVAGTGPRPGPRTVDASLDVVDDATGEVLSTPVEVSATRDGVRVRGAVPVAALREAFGEQVVRARLVVVWQNSAQLFDLASARVADLRAPGSL